jgi:hypothetical protein
VGAGVAVEGEAEPHVGGELGLLAAGVAGGDGDEPGVREAAESDPFRVGRHRAGELTAPRLVQQPSLQTGEPALRHDTPGEPFDDINGCCLRGGDDADVVAEPVESKPDRR